MQNKFKKVLMGTASVLTAGVLMACVNNGTDEDSGDSGGASELSVWIMGDGNEQAQPIFDAFTEETGIEINLQSIPWSASHDRLLTAVASGEGPDVVQMGSTFMPEFVDAGALEDISEHVGSRESLNTENFFEGNVETTEFDGSYYAVPWYTETRALYYRTDLLEEVGYPEGPTTWEELHDAAVELSQRGDNMYGFNVDMHDQSFGFMFGRQNGSEIIDEEGNAVLNESEFVETIEYLQSFVEEGASPNQDLGLEISQTFGGDGIVPMFISGPWMISIINESTTDIEGNWATKILPEGPENNTSNTGGANLAVWSGSENVDEAMDLIEHMVSSESLMSFYETSSSLPARIETWEHDTLQEEMISVFGDQLENSEHMPLITEWDSVAQAYLSSIEQILVGGADIQETLDSLNAEVQNIID